jgi:predicted tellurium resistance membrane protein TerC
MFDALLTTDGLISLLTLTALEIVLGIDNIIFVSIIAGRLPANKQQFATNLGLVAATVIRIALLFVIQWIIGLDEVLFTVLGNDFTGKGLILLVGGLFLVGKSTSEIHAKIEGHEEVGLDADNSKKINNLGWAIVQIIFINIIFSFDSILTAVGLVKDLMIMIISVILSLAVMLLFIHKVNAFVNKHPTVKMLALSFLIMIGVLLTVEAFHKEVPKGYVYFSMAFAFGVELLNIRMRKKTEVAKVPHKEVNSVE